MPIGKEQELKLDEVLKTFFSMILFAIGLALVVDAWVAVGLTLMLFVHEMGHIAASYYKGYKVSSPVFIPFFGAFVSIPRFKSLDDEAFIGYGGPFIGGLATALLFGVWALLPVKYPTLLEISFYACAFNILNLIPVPPFDGWRIVQPVSARLKWLGLILVVALTVAAKDSFFLLVIILLLTQFGVKSIRVIQISVALLVIMGALVFFDYDSRMVDLNCLYLFIAAYIVSYRYTAHIRRGRPQSPLGLDEKSTTELAQPMTVRLKWLGLYLVLLVGLIALAFIQRSHMS